MSQIFDIFKNIVTFTYSKSETVLVSNLKIMTFDIHFNDEESSNSKGFSLSLDEAKQYIADNNGTNNSYFADYKGGVVSIVSNETEEVVFEEEVK